MTRILVTMADILGSAPRDQGATMIVTADTLSGSIGGGALEQRAIEVAREMLATGVDERELRLPLGPTLQQCCGGYVILRLAATEQRAVEPYRQRESLYLYGAGHVGRAVIQALSALPFDIVWVDQRETWTPTPADHRQAISGDPLETARSAKEDAYHLIMTHDHALDLELCAELLARDDVAHVGLIGSTTKKARFASQLRARGLSDGQLSRLICPIGIVGIKGKEPSIIAAGVAAELLLVRSRRLRALSHGNDVLHA